MASGDSLPSLITSATDGEEYISAQEEVESYAGTQNEATNQKEAGDADENDTDGEVDINELTVFLPKVPQPELPIIPRTAVIKPTSKSKHRIHFIEQQQEKSQIRKILCGIAVSLIMFGLAAGMIFMAFMFDIDDLFIIGGMFIFGGTVFTVGFIIVRCTVVLPYGKRDLEAASATDNGHEYQTSVR